MSKEEITKEILSILGNFKLSENIQIKELVALYMKKQQEIERLNNAINKVIKYISLCENTICSGEAETIINDLLEILDKENL